MINNEQGQILMSGLLFLCLSLLIFGYYFFVAEYRFAMYFQEMQEKEELLKDASIYAHKLNMISYNNQSILEAILQIQEAHSSSSELGLYVGFSQPYWETYKNNSVLNSFKHSDYLSVKSKSLAKNIFERYHFKAARALNVAKALSEKNNKIVNSFPMSIKKFFKQSSLQESFCFALDAQYKKFKFPGYHHFIFLESLYSFYFTKNNCQLKHVNKIFSGLNFKIPLLLSDNYDMLIDYKNIFKNVDSKLLFGLTMVSQHEATLFIESLILKSNEHKIKSKVFLLFYNYFFKILDIKREKYIRFKHDFHARITHPYFICDNKNKSIGHFISEEDYRGIDSCHLSKNYFLQSFFKANWTPLLTEGNFDVQR